jgi:hypothetical protein
VVKKTFLAGILTLLIFMSGLSLGFFWDKLREDKLSQELNKIATYSSALFVESMLIEDAGCSSMSPLIDQAVSELSDALTTYQKYADSSRSDLDYQKTLYRGYLFSNVKYWLFAKQFQEKCGWNNSIVLFFFGSDCPECDVVSSRLGYLKNKYNGDVLIFPINMELASGDPVAETLSHIYNATSYPSVIVDGRKANDLSKENLEALVCERIC